MPSEIQKAIRQGKSIDFASEKDYNFFVYLDS